jgi:O-antigen/teichoic acid export membrane protein
MPEGRSAYMFRTALLILSGNAASSLLLLARNLIVARLISVTDYGIAATFAVAMAVVEMMSALGLQQQIVQAKEGDQLRFQAALQGFQVLRGLVTGAVLFVMSGWFAAFLGIPEVAWAYQLLALVPVLNALQHFDIHRLNRQMRFAPLIWSKAVPAILSLAALWPLALWLDDWRIMLWAILIQAMTGAVASHLLAERPYRLVFDRIIMAQSLRFGWPLLVNGILMFLVFQADKLIVGRELGMDALALFAMGMTLTLTPTLVLAGSASNFFLPQLSKTDRATPEGMAEFRLLAHATQQSILMTGVFFVLAVVVLGGPVINLLLGDKYLELLPLLTWFSIMQAIRLMKAGPAIIALAEGQSSNSMIANMVRALVLPGAWYVAATSGDLRAIIWIAILGEIVAHATALWLLRRGAKLPLAGGLVPHICVGLCLAVSAWRSYATSADVRMDLPTLSLIGVCFLTACTMHSLHSYVTTLRKSDRPS